MEFTCTRCRSTIEQKTVNHSFHYDGGDPVVLRDVTQHTCATCEWSEIEIPRIENLIEIVGQATKMLRIRDRSRLIFRFDKGLPPDPWASGSWTVILRPAL